MNGGFLLYLSEISGLTGLSGAQGVVARGLQKLFTLVRLIARLPLRVRSLKSYLFRGATLGPERENPRSGIILPRLRLFADTSAVTFSDSSFAVLFVAQNVCNTVDIG